MRTEINYQYKRRLILMETYYNPEDLAKFATMGEDAPELWDKFMDFYGAAMGDGALTAREKALIAFSVALAIQCPYCIHSYTETLLQMGVSEEEMSEAAFTVAALRGGASLVHGVQMKNIVNKLEQ